MKILFITDLYPVSQNESLTPRTLYSFVEDWIKLGHDVQVLKPNFLLNSFIRKKPFYRTGQYKNIYNVNYHTPFLFDVTKKIPNFDYDVIISHMPSGVIFSNRLIGKKICAVHASDIEVLTNPFYSIYFKPQMEKAYKNCNGIACRSQTLKNKFLKLYPEYESKIFLCESGINIEPILKEEVSRKKILTCANLIKRKNVDKLICAINDMPDLSLTVIGDGPELKKIQKFSNKNINFTGRLDNSKVLEIMKKSDIFILPSVNETFGMVYLEAMACGCITVGIKNDGIDGIIKDGSNGFLTYPNQESIKNVLNRILNTSNNDILSILQNCYNTAKYYNSLDCAERYIQNILKII